MTANTQPNTVFDTLAVQRRPVALALAGLGIACIVVAVWWCVWGWPTPTNQPEEADAGLLGKNKERPKAKDKEKDKETIVRKHSTDYLPAGVWAGLVAVACMGGAAWLITQPLPDEGRSSVVRAEVLTFGSVIGLLTALLGVAFGVSWYKSLFIWLNENNTQEARWVLIAVAVFVAGLVTIFFSVQVARTEERANVLLRRVAYGFNTVFMGMLLLLVLAAVNVVSFMKLPGMLVTNDAAFTELAEPSKKFLRSLDRPVHAYLVMPEKLQVASERGLDYKNLYTDCRALLNHCEAQSPRFKVSYLSPAFDLSAVEKLLDRMKVTDKASFAWGIVLAFGDQDDFVHIPYDKLLVREATGVVSFQGEQRVLTELIAKTSSLTDKTIYFTQNHGELSIDPATGGTPRSAYQMLETLRERKAKIAPLKLDDAAPKIPDDAAMVIVAGPQQKIDADSPTYRALKQYLTPTDGNQAPGKLMAFLPALRGPTNTVGPSGLEPLLSEFGVAVAEKTRLVTSRASYGGLVIRGDRIVLAEPARQVPPAFNRTFQAPLPVLDPRAMQVAQANPVFTASPLLTTAPSLGSWRENSFILSDFLTLERQLNGGNEKLRQEKEFTSAGLPLALTVTQGPAQREPSARPAEGQKPRMIVFASETLLQDQMSFPWPPDDEQRRQVISDCVDWLTEREANMGIEARRQAVYLLKKEPSLGSLFMLLGMLGASVIALGIGSRGSPRIGSSVSLAGDPRSTSPDA